MGKLALRLRPGPENHDTHGRDAHATNSKIVACVRLRSGELRRDKWQAIRGRGGFAIHNFLSKHLECCIMQP